MLKYLYDPHMSLYDLSVLIKIFFCSVLYNSSRIMMQRVRRFSFITRQSEIALKPHLHVLYQYQPLFNAELFPFVLHVSRPPYFHLSYSTNVQKRINSVKHHAYELNQEKYSEYQCEGDADWLYGFSVISVCAWQVDREC